MADSTVASQRCHGGEASAAAFAGGGAAQVVAGALFLLDARTICSVGHAAGDGSWCPCSLTFACGCRNPSSHRENNIGGRSNMLFIQEHPKTIKLVNSTSLGNSPSIAQWPSVYAIHTETSSESISPTQALAPHGEMLGPWPSLPSMALLGQATAGGTKKSRGGFVPWGPAANHYRFAMRLFRCA